MRDWFLIGLAAAAACGLLFPEGGALLRSYGFLLPCFTAAALAIAGLGIELGELRAAALDFRSIVLGVGTTFVVAPLIAAGLALAIGPEIAGPGSEGAFFFEAVMLAAAQAGTIASATALTAVASGNLALALLLTVATNTLTVIATPLILRFALGGMVEFPVGDMMLRMALVVALPVVVGQLARRAIGDPVRAWMPRLRTVAQSIVLVFVFTGVAAATDHAGASIGMFLRLLLLAACLHGALVGWLVLATGLLGIDRPSRAALVFCGSQKTLPNAIFLWDRFFPANPLGALAIVTYHVLQLVVDSLLIPWLRPRKD